MPRTEDLYRLELEMAAEVFRDDVFLSINEIAKRTGKSWVPIRSLFNDDALPSVGISKARYAHALAEQRKPTYKSTRALRR